MPVAQGACALQNSLASQTIDHHLYCSTCSLPAILTMNVIAVAVETAHADQQYQTASSTRKAVPSALWKWLLFSVV